MCKHLCLIYFLVLPVVGFASEITDSPALEQGLVRRDLPLPVIALAECDVAVAEQGPITGIFSSLKRKLPLENITTRVTESGDIDRFSVVFSGTQVRFLVSAYEDLLYAQFGVKNKRDLTPDSPIHGVVSEILQSVRKVEVSFLKLLKVNERIKIVASEKQNLTGGGTVASFEIKRGKTVISEAKFYAGISALDVIKSKPHGKPPLELVELRGHRQITEVQYEIHANHMEATLPSGLWKLPYYVGTIIDDRVRLNQSLEVGEDWMRAQGAYLAVGEITIWIQNPMRSTYYYSLTSHVTHWRDKLAVIQTDVRTENLPVVPIFRSVMKAFCMDVQNDQPRKWPKGFVERHHTPDYVDDGTRTADEPAQWIGRGANPHGDSP